MCHSCKSYCSRQCQVTNWQIHKKDCPLYKEYCMFAKKEKNDMSLEKMIDFWQNHTGLLERDRAARMCNTLLRIAYLARQEMGHALVINAHVLNSAILRQIVSLTSVDIIADSYNEKSSIEFRRDTPYLTAGVDAVNNNSIDDYLEHNHASNISIVDSTNVEGEVRIEFIYLGKLEQEFDHDISLDLRCLFGTFSLSTVERDGVPAEYLRFTYNDNLLNHTKETLPRDLGMESRGSYMIHVTALNDKERSAQDVIGTFIWRIFRLKKAKKILARNVIADFILRCHTQCKAQKVIADFIWYHHQRQKARKTIVNFIWYAIAGQRRRRCRSSAISIQSLHRGNQIRKIHLGPLQARLEEMRHYNDVWAQSAEQAPTMQNTLAGWAKVREALDLKQVDFLDDDGNLADTDEKLNQALQTALSEGRPFDSEQNEVKDDISRLAISDGMVTENDGLEDCSEPLDWSQFLVTTHVVKFIQKGDTRFREIFVKRMKQLAKGERSHKLQKPLKGCSSVICEYSLMLY